MNKLRNLTIFPVSCLFLLLSPLHGSSTFAQNNSEAARVNGHVITLEQVNARYTEMIKQGNTENISKSKALEDLIKREVGIQEAKRLKLDADPATQERMNNLLYYALLEKRLASELDRVTISDAEAKSWYEKNPEIRTSHIFLALQSGASAEEEKKLSDKLVQISREVKLGKMSFAEAAQRNSEDPSSAMGGDLGYRTKDMLDPTYYKAATRLSNSGDISSPIRTPFGLHLIRLTARHSWIEIDRSKIKRLVLEERRQAIVDRYLNDLRQKAQVSISKALQN